MIDVYVDDFGDFLRKFNGFLIFVNDVDFVNMVVVEMELFRVEVEVLGKCVKGIIEVELDFEVCLVFVNYFEEEFVNLEFGLGFI